MPTDSTSLYFFSAGVAFIPALIWLSIIFTRTQHKLVQFLIFFGSTLRVGVVFGLQYFLEIFPALDVLKFLQSNIDDQNFDFILLFIYVGIVEEIVKQLLIRLLDKKYLLIQTIKDSIHFSLIGALGFAFAENIFYIYQIYTQLGIQQLFSAYLFRSIFTTCAHLIFSGFFGYYYGIAKFSMDMVEQSNKRGKKLLVTTLVSRLLSLSKIQTYKEITIIKGLAVAIILHASFNYLLQFNQIIPVVIFIIILGGILLHLLKRQSSQLILVTDVDADRASSMAKKDEDVVIELLGMWFNQKKYVDVIHICQRLLQRDPDNKIVQLFKAKAMDNMEDQNTYSHILSKLFPKK